MKLIPLTQGKFTKVDSKDFNYLSQWKWQYCGNYASRTDYSTGKKVRIYMHRVINNTPVDFETDHINRDKLDNRRENLRTVTGRQNQFNTDIRRNNTSGYKYLYWRKARNRWIVQIRLTSGKNRRLGSFIDKSDAIVMVNSLILE